MSWVCRGCGKEAIHIRAIVDDGEIVETCENKDCGYLPMAHAGVPDVYWPGGAYKSEALGVEFSSRSQKAQYLKDNHLTEAGDMKMGQKSWIEGSRDARRKEFAKDRPMIRETLKQWRQRHG